MSESQDLSANPPAPCAPDEKDLAAMHELFADLADRRQRAFLAGLLAGQGLKRAEELSDVSCMCHYQWMENDEVYREHFRLAKTILSDLAQDEVYRRAFLGYDTPVVHAGKITGWYKSYSDTLAQFWLKGMRPEIYGPGAADRPMGPTSMTITVVRPEDREKARAEERARAAAKSTRTISIPGGPPDAAPPAEPHETTPFDNPKEES